MGFHGFSGKKILKMLKSSCFRSYFTIHILKVKARWNLSHKYLYHKHYGKIEKESQYLKTDYSYAM